VGDEFFDSQLYGYVLEYTDSTRTATTPMVGAWLEVILPDGETREFCVGLTVTCYDVQWVSQGITDATGRYDVIVTDRAHCTLRIRAYEFWVNGQTSGRTATGPLLIPQCEHLGVHEGPTLILE
jgi:hypothetical protein